MCYILCCKCFASTSGIHDIVKFGEKSTVLITCHSLVYIYTGLVVILHCGEIYHHVLSWVNQYSQYVGFTFSTTQVTGYPIVLVSQSKYRAMCNWSNNCWWRSDLYRIFRVVIPCGRTGYHGFRIQSVSNMHRPNKK